MEDIFNGLGIEVRLGDSEDFLKIKETLTRIGVASKKENILTQSCHILHKQGRYVIIHFKEMFEMDGKSSNFSEEDEIRRNMIAKLLEEWGLLKIEEPEKMIGKLGTMYGLRVIPFKEKSDWVLAQKYTIGKK